jgi:hypothetical protein
VVRRSFEVRTFTPHQPDAWQAPYERFCKLLHANKPQA